jgi:hypothetical protein
MAIFLKTAKNDFLETTSDIINRFGKSLDLTIYSYIVSRAFRTTRKIINIFIDVLFQDWCECSQENVMNERRSLYSLVVIIQQRKIVTVSTQ